MTNNVSTSSAPQTQESWTGGAGDLNWSTAANWSGGYVPSALTNVTIGSAAAGHSIVLTGSQSVASLTVAAINATSVGDLQIAGNLAVSGPLEIQSGNLFDFATATSPHLAPSSFVIGDTGEFYVQGGSVTVDSNITNNGLIKAFFTHLTINGNVTGTGALDAGSGGTLELNGASAQEVILGYGGTFKIDQTAAFTGQVQVFGSSSAPGNTQSLDLSGSTSFGGSLALYDVGASLDLVGIATTVSSYNGTTLTLGQASGNNLTFTLYTQSGNAGPSVVLTSSDGHGGTLISLAAVTTVDAGRYLYVDSTLTLASALDVSGYVFMGINSFAPVIVAPLITIESGGEVLTRGNATIVGNMVNNAAGASGSGSPYGLVVDGGSAKITGSLTGSGTTTLWGGGLEVGGAVSQNIVFGRNVGAILQLDNPAAFTGTISGVVAGNFAGATNYSPTFAGTIDLANTTVQSVAYSGTTLTVTETNGQILNFTVTGAAATTFADATLTTASDGNGGTDIFWQAGLTQTWTPGVSGAWTTASNWTNGIVPGQFDSVVVGGTATETITVSSTDVAKINLLTITDPSVTLVDAGSLTLGVSPVFSNATVNINSGGSLALVGVTTLDNATINLKGGSIQDSPAVGGVGQAGLVFGAGLTLNHIAGGSYPYNNITVQDGTFLNTGTINAAAAAGQLSISVSSNPNNFNPYDVALSNAGTITVSNGDALSLNGIFDNASTGIIQVGASSTLTAGTPLLNALSNTIPTWSNEGKISVGAGATLTLIGDFNVASLANITSSGGTIVLDGAALDNGTVTNSTTFNSSSGSAGPINVLSGTMIFDPSYRLGSNFQSQLQQSVTGAAFVVGSGATLEFRGDPGQGFTTNGTVTFAGSGGTLRLDDFGDFSGAVNGLAVGDSLDFAQKTITSASLANATLTVTDSTGATQAFAVDTTLAAAGAKIALVADGKGGTLVSFVKGAPSPLAPTITGTKAGQASLSEAAVKPFSAVKITDPTSGATDVLTITYAGPGTLSGAGLSGANGTYTLSGTAAAITSQLNALTFTPVNGVANTSVTTSFTLSDKSSAYGISTVNTTTTVIDTDPAVASTITGTKAGQTTTSEAPVSPFAGVTIADANNGGTNTNTLSIKVTGGGTLSGFGLTGANGSYSLSGTAAVITSELDVLTFTPAVGTPNGSATATFTLSDKNSAYATATVNTTTTVINSDPAVAPTITGTKAGQPSASEAVVKPFSGVTIADRNVGATETLSITFAGGGTLSGTGLVGSNGSYTLSGTAAAVTTQLKGLSFKPAKGIPNSSATTTFTLSDKSSAYATAAVNATTTVIDTDPAIAPTITGTKAGQTTASESPVTPFSGVTIADTNSGGTETLTIKVAGGGGTLSGSSLSGGTGGIYTLSGTAAFVTTAVRALRFTPKVGSPNGSATTTFTLSDKSSVYATATVNATTTVINSDPAVAPTITGTKAGQTSVSDAVVKPFSAVTITDLNVGATETLSITYAGAGTLSGTGLTGSNGNYTLSGTAAAVTTQLKALSFKPVNGVPNTSVTTTFTLSDKSSAYAAATVDTTSTVIDTVPAAAGPRPQAASMNSLVQAMATMSAAPSSTMTLSPPPPVAPEASLAPAH